MINLALLVAQWTFLLLLYVFLFWVARLILADLRQPAAPRRSVAPGRGRLLVLQGEGPARGEEFILSSNHITLGRDPANDLVLADRFASAHHARIAIAEGGYWIEDLGSRNGTLVNGQRIQAAMQLQPGDRIEVGDCVLRFEEGRPA